MSISGTSPTSSNDAAALKFVDFVNASPTPYHAVAKAVARLDKAGFTKISESSDWSKIIKPGKGYYFTRNQSALAAFAVPSSFISGQSGVGLIATHVDSCCLKIRPVSNKVKGDWLQVACELYGGGIWRSWFDRDLSLAGRVIVQTEDEKFVSKLIKIDRPLLRIPSLAIHLDRGSNDSFTFNKETQFTPILGLVSSILNSPSASAASTFATPVGSPEMKEKHHPALLGLLAEELGCKADEIQDFELCLYDTQPACLGGLSNEFIFSPRIDNLMSSFAAVEALTDSFTNAGSALSSSPAPASAILLFDHEEVGSVSHHGAESNMLPSLVTRLTAAGLNVSEADSSTIVGRTDEALAKSFLVSADMGHAMHPNFAEKHQELHQPSMGGGVVIKTNANQRYTSNAQTTFVLRRIAKIAGVPLQEFEVRNDSTCGSTVGPHLSTNVRTVDIGLAQLAMHSIRETAGSKDVAYYIAFMRTFFEQFGKVDQELTVD
ncbi:aspartyl aminopeptidase [Phaffia rhodozyma]|uniref:aspartyl aminopeptidase n=1 Tax=Phaffia rhodozyma TaxID=264483 RepID=A0A0F7SKP4_PHARH|nr:aspartyl aminopeptidase [Phaffia rhodozyma]